MKKITNDPIFADYVGKYIILLDDDGFIRKYLVTPVSKKDKAVDVSYLIPNKFSILSEAAIQSCSE